MAAPTSAASHFDELSKRFRESNDPKDRLAVATEIRDSMETVVNSEYQAFMQTLFPAFFQILQTTGPQFEDSPEQRSLFSYDRLRNMILEIINRLPNNDILKPHAIPLLRLCMILLEKENEENAMICLRIIIDLHKNYRQILESDVQAFLDIVQKLYCELPKTVAILFKETPRPAAPKAAPPQVLTECPIIVVLLFQLYPKFLQINVPKFMPLIVSTLGIEVFGRLDIQAPPGASLHHKAQYTDFIAAQVKTLSFLAYMLRSYSEQLRPYQDQIPQNVINLLNNCPPESVATRKELLIAARHILATDFRAGFVPKIDVLLDENVLVGSGRTAYETLRPLAYSTLADLVHHIRNDLTLPQLNRVIHLYSRNIHDNLLNFNIQTMSAKLLLNLVECIARRNNHDSRGRGLLVRILDTFVNKFKTLKTQIPKLVNDVEQEGESPDTPSVKDCRILIKTLILGLKNIVWGISSCSPQHSQQLRPQTANLPSDLTPEQRSQGMEETLIFIRLLKNGLRCFSVYRGIPPAFQEEKDLLDHFAAIFTMVEAKIFHDVFSTQIGNLFAWILENQSMVTIPQHFLANPGVSRIFAEILMKFLMDNLPELAGSDKTRSATYLRLFKLVFGSVTLFAASLEFTATAKDSTNFFVLLRALFRSVGGAKVDLFSKEFLPVLPDLLTGLNKLSEGNHSPSMKDLFTELALSIPVRLSSLLPCIALLLKPILFAIRSANSDLVVQGLRTLEHYVEHLEADFFEPLLTDIKPELMQALWKHLRPPPYPHGPQALKILGKLAGRNRSGFDISIALSETEEGEVRLAQSFSCELSFSSGEIIQLPLAKTIFFAEKVLSRSPDPYLLFHALNCAKLCLSLVLRLDQENLSGFAADKAEEEVYPPLVAFPPHAVKTREMVEAEAVTVRHLVSSIIIASGAEHEPVRVDALNFLESLCSYASLLFAGQQKPSLARLQELHPNIFVEATLDVLGRENTNFVPLGLRVFDFISSSLFTLLPNRAQTEQLGFFTDFLTGASHMCFGKDWPSKNGGVAALAHLVKVMSKEWLVRNQLAFVRSLLFVLKSLNPKLSVATAQLATETFQKVIELCNSPQTTNNEELQQILRLLVADLHSPRTTLRKQVQGVLSQLATYSRTTIPELIGPLVKETLLPQLSAKSLRSLSFDNQVGYFEALSYCLKLRPTPISITPEILAMANEALNLSDQDDVAAGKFPSQGQITLFTELRVAAIEFLTALITVDEFVGPDPQHNEDWKNRIISIFFKALAFQSPELVALAKQGLGGVVQAQRLPKDLLQICLRPVLLNLADYRKLTLPLLAGLHRLLELLTNCFNVTLGEKLLEHLKNWTEPNKIASQKIWKPGDEPKVAAAIIDIYHLLPPQSNKFLEPLTSIVIQLENLLPREVDNIYRHPLALFLNRHPSEAVQHFLERLAQPAFSKLFWFIIREPDAQPLRIELAAQSARLIAQTFRKMGQQGVIPELQYQGLLIVRTLLKFFPNWVNENENILECLLELWMSKKRMDGDQLSTVHLGRESRMILKCFIAYLRQDEVRPLTDHKFKVLFQIPSIFIRQTTADFVFVTDYLDNQIALMTSPENKRLILQKFLDFFLDPNYEQPHKVQVLQTVITPLLNRAFEASQKGIFDDPLLKNYVEKILDSEQQSYSDAMNIALLQFATLLVRSMTNELVEHRKPLIRFAWNHLKSDDLTSKQSAYVLVCRFIEAYETPPKIILQVYVALLRTFAPETRHLVRQALDILLPALRVRLGDTTAEKQTWIKWTKKIIIEEGHSLPLLVHIFLLLVRHPALFYPSRGQFVPHIVNALARIGLLPNSPQENRRLAVDLVQLIISWEKQRREEATQDKMEVVDAAADDNYIPNSNIVEMLVHFLIRVASSAAEFRPNPAMPDNRDSTPGRQQKALELLCEALTVWPEVNIKFAYFEKLLTAPALPQQPNGPEPVSLVSIGLGILNVIFDYQLAAFVSANVVGVQAALSPSFTTDDLKVATSLCTLLRKLLVVYPSGQPHILSTFYDGCAILMDKALATTDNNRASCLLLVIQTFAESSTAFIEKFVPGLVKLFVRITKDHLSTPQQDAAAQTMAIQNKRQLKETALNLIRIVNLMTLPILVGEPRRLFLNHLQLLLEKSPEMELLTKLTQQLNVWLQSEPSLPESLRLPIKDKVSLVQKMTRFDQLSSSIELHSEFLELIYQIYRDKECHTATLVPAFMMGLRSKDSKLRSKFFEVFQQDIEPTLLNRISHIFAKENWEPLANSYWIKQALSLIFSVVASKPFQRTPYAACFPQINSGSAPRSTEAKQVVTKSNQFLAELRNNNLQDFINSLRELLHQDSSLAHHLWVSIFPRLWSLLPGDKQVSLTPAIQTLAAQEFNTKQQHAQPNVVQTLMEGLARSSPPPRLKAELIRYLSKTFNVWFVGIQLLEEGIAQQEAAGGTSFLLTPSEQGEPYHECLASLYTELNELDLLAGLWAKWAKVPTTSQALALEQHGLWQAAQDLYFSGMKDVLTGSVPQAPKFETTLWEERWIMCAQNLNQWDWLHEFGRAYQNADVLLATSWRTGDWTTLRQLTSRPMQADSPKYKIYQGYLAVNEARPDDLEAIVNQASQLSLKKWICLPNESYVSLDIHTSLLQSFQQIVELQESSLIIKELSGQARHQAMPEIKAILGAWRKRVPDPWDPMVVWSDILTWRQHVFSMINNAYHSLVELNSAVAYIGYHETAWTINKFSHIARKHGLVEVCLNALGKIYSLPNIEIQDAFIKLREQVKCYFQVPQHYRTGLGIINSTNLDYFGPQQKAEFFQLKGEFLTKLGYHDDANAAFSNSAAISESLGKSWVSWGQFCEAQFREGAGDKFGWIEHAVQCYLQGVRTGFRSHSNTRLLGQVLWLLNFDVDFKLAQILEAAATGATIPSSVWIPWIHSLVHGLQRPERQQVKQILSRLAPAHPQALFFPVKVFVEQLKEQPENVNRSGTKRSHDSEPKAPSELDLTLAEEVMEVIQSTNRPLFKDLNQLVTILIDLLTPDVTVRLSELLRDLLYSILATDEQTASTFIPMRLDYIYRQELATSNTEWARDATARFRNDFQKNITVREVISQLKKWLRSLQSLAKPQTVEPLRLEAAAPALVDSYQHTMIEVPGQYRLSRDLATEQIVRVERFASEVKVLRNFHGVTEKLISVEGSNGQLYTFVGKTISQEGPKSLAQSNWAQIHDVLNLVLSKASGTVQRRVKSFAQPTVPLTPRFLLSGYAEELTTLLDTWESFCNQVGIEHDHPLFAASVQFHGPPAARGTPLEIYNTVRAQILPDSILTRYVASAVPQIGRYAAFKKVFVSQLALASVLSFVFPLGLQNAENLMFSVNTAHVLLGRNFPQLSPTGDLADGQNMVPFRLTPNLVRFMNPTHICGTFTRTVIAVALALREQETHLTIYLRHFLRDILTWQSEGLLRNELTQAAESAAVKINARVLDLAPLLAPEELDRFDSPVLELIDAASSPDNLAQMPSTYFPWL